MSNNYDGYDDLTADAREDGGSDGGGTGAALAVLVTLMLGCGLVFAAYKLGQRTGIEDIPTLTAEQGPIKEVPLDAGGTPIPNTDNDAYRMVDKKEPPRTGYVVQDGIVVSEPLPERQLAPATSIETTELRGEIIDFADIRPSTSIEGEPDLTPSEIPDRTNERMLAGGAEIVAPTGDVVPTERAALDAPGEAEGPVVAETAEPATSTEVGELEVAPDTVVVAAVNPAGTSGSGRDLALTPLPRRKPADFGQRAVSPASAIARNPVQRAPAQRPAAPQPQPQVAASTAVAAPARVPQAQPARVIPPQPVGDAQVQLGALPSQADVRARWTRLKAANPDLLGQLGLQVLPVATAQGQLFRLRAGPLPNGRAAAQLCDQLSYRGIECFVPARGR